MFNGHFPRQRIDWIYVHGLVEIELILFIEFVTLSCFIFVTKSMLLTQK